MPSYGASQYGGVQYAGAGAVPAGLSASVGFDATIGSGAITIARQLSSTTSLVLSPSSTLDIHAALTSTVSLDAQVSGTLALFGVPLTSSVAFEARIVDGLFDVHQTGTVAPQAANCRLAVVDRQGVVYGWMPKADIGKMGWKLDDPAEANWETLPLDPAAALLPLTTFPKYEVQIWRKRTDKPLWWGRPLHPNAGKETLSWTAKDLLSWFGTRNVGKPKHDYLAPYGSFDLDPVGTFPPSGWTRNNIESPDGAIVINNMITGGKSVQVNSSTDDVNAYLQRRIDGITPNDVAPFVASVYFYTADIHWIGPAFGALGLWVQACAADGSVLNAYWDGGLVEDSIEKDAWHRLVVLCGRPAGVDHYLYNLSVPGGWSVYDSAEMVLPESLSYQNVDLGEFEESLSVHAQSVAEGKSDLNIGRSHTVTGRQVNRNLPFEEGANFLGTMQEYTGVASGADISVQYPDAHTRTFTVHWPRQGTTRTTELRYSTAASPASNCSDFTLSVDGETIATSVREVGPGSGPEREEAVATDTTMLDGLILELIESLPAGSGIGELVARGTARVGQAKVPVIALTMTTADVSLVDDWENEDLGLGDTVDVVVDWGPWCQIDESMRIVACEYDPKMEALTLTLNVDPVAVLALTNPSDQHSMWLGGVAGRISNLEKRPQPTPMRPQPLWQVFNLTGPLLVSTSDPWTVPTSRMLSQVTVDLTASGSTATVVTVYRDGVSVGTITVSAYATTHTEILVVPYKAGSVISAGVTTAGTDAQGIVITPETVLAQAA